MKTVKIERTETTFLLPADDIRAAYQCASTEEARFYLRGIFVTPAKLIGLDGTVMLVMELPDDAHVGAGCMTQEGGFILSADVTDKAFRANTGSAGDLWVYGDTETGLLQFVAYNGHPECVRIGVCEFERVDGTFPAWERVVAQPKAGGPCAFDPKIFQKLVKASDIIEKNKPVRVWPGENNSEPMAVEFKASARMKGTLMPVRWNQT